jgi:hypothetical protein
MQSMSVGLKILGGTTAVLAVMVGGTATILNIIGDDEAQENATARVTALKILDKTPKATQPCITTATNEVLKTGNTPKVLFDSEGSGAMPSTVLNDTTFATFNDIVDRSVKCYRVFKNDEAVGGLLGLQALKSDGVPFKVWAGVGATTTAVLTLGSIISFSASNKNNCQDQER